MEMLIRPRPPGSEKPIFMEHVKAGADPKRMARVRAGGRRLRAGGRGRLRACVRCSAVAHRPCTPFPQAQQQTTDEITRRTRQLELERQEEKNRQRRQIFEQERERLKKELQKALKDAEESTRAARYARDEAKSLASEREIAEMDQVGRGESARVVRQAAATGWSGGKPQANKMGRGTKVLTATPFPPPFRLPPRCSRDLPSP